MLNQLPEKCDAIIVGSGAAGLIAALSLKTGCPDAEVLLVEKTERLGGTTTYSGGICWLPGHRHKADPATDSRQARLYLRNIFPEIREDHLETFIATAPTVVDFMQDHGLEMEAIDGYPDYYSDIEGSSTGRSLSPAAFTGGIQGAEKYPLPDSRGACDVPAVYGQGTDGLGPAPVFPLG
jgi:3-oxosteroid 1-dehydrogenase